VTSLQRERDEALAIRAARGDGEAFGELAARYQPLLCAAARRLGGELEPDDARQVALIGLFEACRATDGVRCFAGIARLRVRWGVSVSRRAARAQKHRVLTDAERPDEISEHRLAGLAGSAAADPARVVVARDELRTRLQERREQVQRRANAPKSDLRRRYSDEQTARALAMISGGRTVTEAAVAVGAACSTVKNWVNATPPDSPARRALEVSHARAPGGNLSRRFSDEQIARAVALVADGSTISAAAATVGTSWATVQRWIRQAAA
jgi:transposase